MMKFWGKSAGRIISTFLLGMCLGGCETVGERMQGKFGPLPSQTETYEADKMRSFEAARTVLTQLGFRIVRGGAAQGRLDAVSSIRTDDHFRGSRQLELRVRFDPTVDGGTNVQVVIMELIEDDTTKSSGMGVAAPLKDSAVYKIFFRSLREALGESEKG
jgi:hypothetical protein